MIHAAQGDDRAIVDLLLEAGAAIDQRSGWWAGSFGVLDHSDDVMSEYLLARGATLTPHAAARLGRLDALRAMLDRDPAAVHQRGGDGQMPLHFARTVAIADLLLERGAAIDARDIDHESTAAQWRSTEQPEVAAHLVARGAATDPFLLALIDDRKRLALALDADPERANMRLTRERYPVSAPAAGHIYMYVVGEGCTLLHAAARGGQADLIRRLIERGGEPDLTGGYDAATPMHVAAWHDHADTIDVLIAGGADLNARSGEVHRNEPLGWAIVSGAHHAVARLIERGATVRDVHREDAAAGARGEFHRFSRGRALDDWRAIETRVTTGS